MIARTDTAPELRALAEALGGRPTPCQSTDPEVWFGLDPEPAIRLCGGCHAQPECRDLARANGETYGVWGAQLFERKRAKSVAA